MEIRARCPRCGSKYINHLGYCLECMQMTVYKPSCPRCGSNNVLKNGIARMTGGDAKQRYKCKECNRKFQDGKL